VVFVAICSVYIWSTEGVVKEKYCVGRRARFSGNFLFEFYFEGALKQ